ncbi:SDR family NAD(P)-dependent oxidoreductase [Corynebacterium glyciniphilum]|uniref:SDR family NAD(P)-dependent oxidoreductase n=1 Tax=Corynebacterium glyciniphilum TaxID=1404244 RepID=UPI003FD65766
MINGSSAVIVTGAGGGIGRSTVQHLISDGVAVVGVDRPGAFGDVDYVTVEADLSTDDGRQHLTHRLTEIRQIQGPFGGLVSCAGVSGDVGAYSDIREADERRVFEVNYFALGAVTRVVTPLLGEGAAIVNIASVDGVTARPLMAHYSASKHAVVGLTRSIAKELAGRGIRVNAVAPGPTETTMMQSIGEEQSSAVAGDAVSYRKELEARVPLGRYALADEIADAACFLLSSQATYITGVVLPVDGGLTC